MTNSKEKKAVIRYALIPDKTEFLPVYPKEREWEILSCTDQKVKAQKYWVWKLFESILKREFGLDITSIDFQRLESGKWTAKDFYFSFSHSNELVVVAISHQKIGVDVELCRDINKDAVIKTLTTEEQKEYQDSADKNNFLLEKWSQKESIFKLSDEEKFLPSKIDTKKYNVKSERISAKDKEYILSLALEHMESFNVILSNV